jgi:uncharacterized protein YegJ (DUF2314 family)
MNFFKRLFGFKDSNLVSRRRDQADVYHVNSEAERMNLAMEKARLTLKYFKQSLIKPRPDQNYFSLKARIEDGPEIEHLWLNNVSFDETDNFYGTIGNKPLTIKNVSLGKAIGITLENISDWMILEDGKLVGGYTIRVTRDELTEKELRKFDEQLGFIVDEGVDYFDHNFLTPEGAILCIEDAYDAEDLERVLACKDFESEARLTLRHSRKMEKFAGNPEIISETEKVMRLAFIKFIGENGFPSFKNVKRAFVKKEFVHDDLCIVTEVCHYPDRTKSMERLYVGKKNGMWKVLGPAD